MLKVQILDCVAQTQVVVKKTDSIEPVAKFSTLLIQAYGDCVESPDVPKQDVLLDEVGYLYVKPKKA